MNKTKPADIWKFVSGNETAIANHLRAIAEMLPPSTRQRAKNVARRMELSVKRGPDMGNVDAQQRVLANRDMLAIVSPLLERAGESESNKTISDVDMLSDLQIGVCRLTRCGGAVGSIVGLFAYPGLLMVGLIGILVLFSRMIAPNFRALLDSFGIELPLPTKVVLGVSQFIETAWPLFVLISLLAALPIFIEFCRGTGLLVGLVQWIDNALAGKRMAVATWARHIALLLQSRVADDVAIETSMRSAEKWMRSGKLPWRFGVLQETLKLEDTSAKVAMLNQTADFYHAHHRSWVQWWASFLPTILISFLGALFAFVIVSILMPLVAIISGLTGGTVFGL